MLKKTVDCSSPFSIWFSTATKALMLATVSRMKGLFGSIRRRLILSHSSFLCVLNEPINSDELSI